MNQSCANKAGVSRRQRARHMIPGTDAGKLLAEPELKIKVVCMSESFRGFRFSAFLPILSR